MFWHSSNTNYVINAEKSLINNRVKPTRQSLSPFLASTFLMVLCSYLAMSLGSCSSQAQLLAGKTEKCRRHITTMLRSLARWIWSLVGWRKIIPPLSWALLECILYTSLPQAAAFWLLPAECEHDPTASSASAPPQGLFVGQQLPGFARPFSWQHWRSSGSGRGGNRHLAPRQELKLVQPCSSLSYQVSADPVTLY